ncbi:ArsR family transcriptional regulator [Vibrio nigripulchritudo ATCC 27043]|uniref:ArsR/SmtB family transcription factor n=1 Tax=Vibrio nigripulchritudo TaxID=28173 RepID=UPI00021C0E89|nr:metalloregulator ArsR/SmtB family transcription factor [Vibrio nigripulchritudo]EGU51636.1 ArsR family transcriptional regulator [Vibrio nigripulchritudo ATCC 27043]
MARAKTTYDPFNAIAEPKRRELLEKLAGKEMTVTELVDLLGWNQPTVSKHLGVLKAVDLVRERKEGRFRAYSVNGEQLKLIQNWVIQFEQYWTHTLDSLGDYLQDIQQGDKDE